MRYNQCNILKLGKFFLSIGIVVLLLSSYKEIKAETRQNSTSNIVVANENKQVEETQTVKFRIPKEEKIREFKKQKEFNYTEEPPKVNWLQRILDSIIIMMNRAGREVFSSSMMKYLVLIIVALCLLFLILKLMKISPKRLLGRKKLRSNDEINIASENVHEMDFSNLISNAIKDKNYRLATRFLYLRNLKQLSDKEFVIWRSNKTNMDYVRELQDEKLQNNFLKTSLIFDHIWYGELNVNEEMFEVARTELDNFEKLLDNE